MDNYTKQTHSLSFLGWDSHFQQYIDSESNNKIFPARVVGVHKNSFLINSGAKEILVSVSGRLMHKKENLFPVIGDWVLVADTMVVRVLPRKNALSRGAAGTHGKQGVTPAKAQLMAANLDTVFIVSGMDRDYNIRRIERYLTLVYNCGLNPVIILTKADLHQNPDPFVQEVESVAFGVPVHLVSALTDNGLESLASYIQKGQTVTLIGSSGAGKSTLINRLYGNPVQSVMSVSKKLGKGRHTTTQRSLIKMPQGGLVIDNPGIREIGLQGETDGLEKAFPEIEERADQCRFKDCSHTHEPGCRVLHGIASGEISQERLDSFHKMKRELAYQAERQHKSADRLEKERWKEVSMKIRTINKNRS